MDHSGKNLEELEAVQAAIASAWDEGCPVAGPQTELASIAFRGWYSSERRGVKRSEYNAKIRDLTAGLIQQDPSPHLVGPLKHDYVLLARKIAEVLEPEHGR